MSASGHTGTNSALDMLYKLYNMSRVKRRGFLDLAKTIPHPFLNFRNIGMSAPQTISPLEAETALLELNQELNRLQRTIRLAIQGQLSKMVGRSFDDLEKNRELADSIHQVLDSHGLRVCCLECGHPAILRVSPRGNGSGVFVFDHTIDGKRTFHGGRKTVPIIRLVAKPPRKPRQTLTKPSTV